jgi:hypothetical protein
MRFRAKPIEIFHQDGAIVAMTRRDDIHTHDIAFDRPDFDPVEHRRKVCVKHLRASISIVL